MYSILIALFTMILSIFFIKKIAAYLGLAVKIKSLFICAICAVIIAAIYQQFPIILPQYNLLLILCAALGSAVFITHYNEKLLIANHPNDTSNNTQHSRPTKQAIETSHPRPAAAQKQPQIIAVIPAAPSPSAKLQKINKHLHKKANCLNDISTESVAEISTITKQLWLPVSLPSIKALMIIPNEQLAAAIEPANAPAAAACTVNEPNTQKIKPSTKLKKFNRFFQRQCPAAIPKLPDLSALTTLDSLLEYADQQKQLNAWENAIAALKQALILYENDDYAPFIAIELGNFYKNTGLYDEAIVIYNRACCLPTVIDNALLQKDFQKNITYLHIVKTILSKHNYYNINFTEIPAPIMQEIETRFSQQHVS